MGKFIMLSSLTEKGAKTIKQKPERIKEVNKEVEKMGGKILAQYAIL
ncbi:MAG: GYD domain-containing protein, partial [Candidatus Omnitrophica bacterium]|nr:GYD domain-containing protein [Candidatus Omnitrophota bacterium]